MKKFKVTFTKVLEVEAKDVKSAIKEAEMLFKHYHMNEIPVKAKEVKPKKISERQKMINDFGKMMKEEGVTSVEFSESGSFVWQRRMHCADVFCMFYNGNKEVEIDDMDCGLNEILRSKIRAAATDYDYMKGEVVLKLFKPLGIAVMVTEKDKKGKDGKPFEVTADYDFNVEEGNDS